MLRSIYDANNNNIVDAAETVPWSGITGLPATFPPSSHSHPGTDITSQVASAASADVVPWSGVTDKPSTFPPEAHQHPGTDITSQVASAASADSVPWSGVGSPPVALQHMDAITAGARLFGGGITSNGNGTVAIAAGGGLSKTDDAGPEDGPASEFSGQGSRPVYVEWDAVASLALTDNAYNYIYYDGSDEAIKATTDFYSISFTQDFTLGRCYRTGNVVVIRLCGTNAWNFNRRVQLFGEEVFPVVRARGMMLSASGTRNIAITAGILWAELVNRFTVDAFDSSGADRFTYWYNRTSWQAVVSQSQIDNDRYDLSGTLTSLTAGRYGVHWVYVVHDSSVHVVYGAGNYTLAQAEAATPPALLPGMLAAYATLIGKIIIQRGATAFYSVQSAFTTTFTGSGVVSHNDLADLTTGDPHTQYILKATFDANTILKADSDDTPAALTVGASTIVGRAASGGIAALSASQVRTILDLATLYAAAWHGHSHALTAAQTVPANHTLTLDHLDLSDANASVDLESGAALHLIG